MKFVLVACILLAAVDGLQAAQCHSCSYTFGLGGECKDPFDSTGNSTETCEGTYCLKSLMRVKGQLTLLDRSCSEHCSKACMEVFGVESCTYCCQGDKCNRATSLSFSICTIVFMVIFVKKLSV